MTKIVQPFSKDLAPPKHLGPLEILKIFQVLSEKNPDTINWYS